MNWKGILAPGKTCCFVGSSGVGKSTLINSLAGRELLETKAVSSSGEGRHTSVRRELIVLESGALLIDNPGIREFGVLGAENGIEASYADVLALASQYVTIMPPVGNQFVFYDVPATELRAVPPHLEKGRIEARRHMSCPGFHSVEIALHWAQGIRGRPG